MIVVGSSSVETRLALNLPHPLIHPPSLTHSLYLSRRDAGLPGMFGQSPRDFTMAMAETTVLYNLAFPIWIKTNLTAVGAFFRKKHDRRDKERRGERGGDGGGGGGDGGVIDPDRDGREEVDDYDEEIGRPRGEYRPNEDDDDGHEEKRTTRCNATEILAMSRYDVVTVARRGSRSGRGHRHPQHVFEEFANAVHTISPPTTQTNMWWWWGINVRDRPIGRFLPFPVLDETRRAISRRRVPPVPPSPLRSLLARALDRLGSEKALM